MFFSAGGGIGLQHCTITDDGVRCALEYNCVRRGSHDLPLPAGIAIYERSASGLEEDESAGPVEEVGSV